MNPILPIEYCIPDGEPRVFGDRVYLYGSSDQPGEMNYCSHEYYVFSASIDNLSYWTSHGLSFASRGPNNQVPWSDAELYAPDVIEKEGTYYLYFCLSDGSEGIATSQSPEGPFVKARQLFYPSTIHNGEALKHIDPSAFVDDDGSVYYYWGQFDAQCAKLKNNMYELEPATYQESLISEANHYFHEGSSMRKIADTYYLIYCGISTGRANTLNYATSKSPLGPFDYRGEIINNVDADPESWNIHGSIVGIKDQWYVVYHRSSNNSRFSRRACMEPIWIESDGSIRKVEMTTGGTEGLISPYVIMPAYRACQLCGGNYITNCSSGTSRDFILMNNVKDTFACFKYYDFGENSDIEQLKFTARVYVEVDNGSIELMLDDVRNIPIGVINMTHIPCNEWVDVEVLVNVPKGKHALVLKFVTELQNQSVCQLSYFSFECKSITKE